MWSTIRQGLSSKNGFVRKGSASLLAAPRWWKRRRSVHLTSSPAPPVFANSFPKSGTHLLLQIAEGLPNTVNYGEFLSSMTSSFQFRVRPPDNSARVIRKFVPGEIVRGHLFFHPQTAMDLEERTPSTISSIAILRDVVVSEAHYLREMNGWHRLSPYFHNLPSIEAAITLSIRGLSPPIAGLEYPNIGECFMRFQGWLTYDNCLPIRFEDLVSESRDNVMHQMVKFYARHCTGDCEVDACLAWMRARIAPQKSHTFRSGKKSGWLREFTSEHRRAFAEVAGDLLIQLGYERNFAWVDKGASSGEAPVKGNLSV